MDPRHIDSGKTESHPHHSDAVQHDTEPQQLHTLLLSVLPNLRILIGLSIAALVICGLYFGRSLLIPLALATFLGFLLNPAVLKLKQWGLPHIASVMTVITVCLGLLVAGTTYLGMQLVSLSQQLPTYQDTIQQKSQNLKAYTEGPSVWDGAINTFALIQQTISGSALDFDHDNPEKANQPIIPEVKIAPSSTNAIDQALSWIAAISTPLVTSGIALLFVILILINRSELRDRILLILGSNLNIATDMLNEAAVRVGTYLRMQLIVNASYGIPMGMGLWLIGVPAAFLWGTIAVVLRFIPYIGPVISSIFPLALAFAVDPSWDMVLWTIGLILVLELVSNNVIEPWLYGSSTGLSTLSIILAATFWTAIWGPIGLILSTPITACLLVFSRSIPALRFIEVVLGSAPVLDTPQRFYQRLLAQNITEAVDLAETHIETGLNDSADSNALARKVVDFYDDVAIAAMRLFSSAHNNDSTARHRLRMNLGLAEFIQHMYRDYPVNEVQPHNHLRIVSIGARWYVDDQAAAMTTHALQLSGFQAQYHPHALLQNHDEIQVNWQQTDVVCVSLFNPEPTAQIRLIARQLRQYQHLYIIILTWNSNAQTLSDALLERFHLTAVLDSIHNLTLHLQLLPSTNTTQTTAADFFPHNEVERLAALRQSDVLDTQYLPVYQHLIKQTLLSFATDYAQIAWVDETWVNTPASPLHASDDTQSAGIARADSICTYVVYQNSDLILEDLHTDPRFTNNEELSSNRIRFYAGTPLRNKKGLVLGCLSIMDTEPRSLSTEDLEVLHNIANYIMQLLQEPKQLQSLLNELQNTTSPTN